MGKKAMNLGKGLRDIMMSKSAEGTEETKDHASSISLNIIDPNPYQPRKFFNDESLQELTESIKMHGVLEPVLLRKKAGRYQIISGERRVRAARLAGLREIEARVFDLLSDKTMAEWAIIENIQREDLNSIELANSYQKLLDSHGYTHDDLAERLGKSRAAVTNSLRLLKLPAQVQKWIQEGKLSAGAARSLLSPNISNPEKLAKKIIEEGFSVREVELMVQEPTKKPGKKQEPSSKHNPDMQHFLNTLQNALGTRVSCKVSKKSPQKGTLLIDYSSFDDLTRIQNALNL
ncbi:MAG: ParB/RepB/Spo0J family partition protein [Fibromonadaceae bacterium]|jgi:ParB family chromosome partitioning protein|nr:ParB/RepB/Spo0J family partition protein [Fibromonadaceae bacterium]